MSASICQVNNSDGSLLKLELLSKIETPVSVNMAVFVPNEDGVIGACEDRSLRIWLKRDNGLFWPSVCQFLTSAATALHFHAESQRLFVGSDNGTISEFEVSSDFNSIQHRRDYLAHSGRITAVVFAFTKGWILSCARDKYFSWHSTSTGHRCGGYQTAAWCTSLQYDAPSQYAFVGDYSGLINILKLSEDTLEVISTLNGHEGSVVRALSWDAQHEQLASASFDHSVIVWDIGGRKGTAYELQGHHDKVLALAFAPSARLFISAGDDHTIVFWRMSVHRQETPTWTEGDTCVRCNSPFFWNVRKMWDDGKVGVRQHHCRKCGQVVCDKCSNYRTIYPPMGFELPVRVCEECYQSVQEGALTSLAFMADAKHSVNYLSLDEHREQLLTVGGNNMIKIWDISPVLRAATTV